MFANERIQKIQLTTRSYDTGTIGGILKMDYFVREFATTEGPDPDTGKIGPVVTGSQQSEIVSLLSAGTFFGALTASPAGDYLGRRMGLIASTVVFSIGVILQTAATTIPLFVAGRFFAGYGVGMLSALGMCLFISHILHLPLKPRFRTHRAAKAQPKPEFRNGRH